MNESGGGDRPDEGGLRELETGTSDPIEVEEVSRALAQLWASAGSGGRERLVRACQGNLILWGLPTRSKPLERMVEEMTRVRPVRVVILGGAPAGSPVKARVSALCHLRGFRERVCCEKILLTLPDGSEDLTASAVRAMLRGDVPVALWCPGEAPLDLPAFLDLCREADLFLLDSALLRDAPAALRKVRRLMEENPGLHPLDSNWDRLAGARRTVAQLFDPPEARARIPQLQRVRIEISGGGSGVPASGILLAGWILNVLERSDVAVDLPASAGGPNSPPYPRRIEFLFGSGSTLGADLEPPAAGREIQPARLAEILGQRSGDPVFEEALRAGAGLEPRH